MLTSRQRSLSLFFAWVSRQSHVWHVSKVHAIRILFSIAPVSTILIDKSEKSENIYTIEFVLTIKFTSSYMERLQQISIRN